MKTRTRKILPQNKTSPESSNPKAISNSIQDPASPSELSLNSSSQIFTRLAVNPLSTSETISQTDDDDSRNPVSNSDSYRAKIAYPRLRRAQVLQSQSQPVLTTSCEIIAPSSGTKDIPTADVLSTENIEEIEKKARASARRAKAAALDLDTRLTEAFGNLGGNQLAPLIDKPVLAEETHLDLKDDSHKNNHHDPRNDYHKDDYHYHHQTINNDSGKHQNTPEENFNNEAQFISDTVSLATQLGSVALFHAVRRKISAKWLNRLLAKGEPKLNYFMRRMKNTAVYGQPVAQVVLTFIPLHHLPVVKKLLSWTLAPFLSVFFGMIGIFCFGANPDQNAFVKNPSHSSIFRVGLSEGWTKYGKTGFVWGGYFFSAIGAGVGLLGGPLGAQLCSILFGYIGNIVGGVLGLLAVPLINKVSRHFSKPKIAWLTKFSNLRTNNARAGMQVFGSLFSILGFILGTFAFPGLGSVAGMILFGAIGAVFGGIFMTFIGPKISRSLDPENKVANSWDYSVRTLAMVGDRFGFLPLLKVFLPSSLVLVVSSTINFTCAIAGGMREVFYSLYRKAHPNSEPSAHLVPWSQRMGAGMPTGMVAGRIIDYWLGKAGLPRVATTSVALFAGFIAMIADPGFWQPVKNGFRAFKSWVKPNKSSSESVNAETAQVKVQPVIQTQGGNTQQIKQELSPLSRRGSMKPSLPSDVENGFSENTPKQKPISRRSSMIMEVSLPSKGEGNLVNLDGEHLGAPTSILEPVPELEPIEIPVPEIVNARDLSNNFITKEKVSEPIRRTLSDSSIVEGFSKEDSNLQIFSIYSQGNSPQNKKRSHTPELLHTPLTISS